MKIEEYYARLSHFGTCGILSTSFLINKNKVEDKLLLLLSGCG